MFLEEPVWPPEDFATLAEVRTKGGLNIAAGENACTAHQFREMMKAGAVSHAQPSVIKVGGITEYLKVVALADEFGVRLAPHSPYFGPGFLATLQLMSLRDDATFVEVFYMKRAACLWRGRIDVDANGDIEVPQGPGSATSRTRRSWSNTGCPDRGCVLLRAVLCRRGILRGRRSSLLRVVSRLALRRLQLGYHFLQPSDRALQRLDLPVGGVDFLLMVRR